MKEVYLIKIFIQKNGVSYLSKLKKNDKQCYEELLTWYKFIKKTLNLDRKHYQESKLSDFVLSKLDNLIEHMPPSQKTTILHDADLLLKLLKNPIGEKNKAKREAYFKAYNNLPGNKAKRKAYLGNPENKAKRNANDRANYKVKIKRNAKDRANYKVKWDVTKEIWVYLCQPKQQKLIKENTANSKNLGALVRALNPIPMKHFIYYFGSEKDVTTLLEKCNKKSISSLTKVEMWAYIFELLPLIGEPRDDNLPTMWHKPPLPTNVSASTLDNPFLKKIAITKQKKPAGHGIKNKRNHEVNKPDHEDNKKSRHSGRFCKPSDKMKQN